MDLAGCDLAEQLLTSSAWQQVPSVCGLHRTDGHSFDSFLWLSWTGNISSCTAQTICLRAVNAKLLVAFWQPISSFSCNSSASKLLLGDCILLPPTLLTPTGHHNALQSRIRPSFLLHFACIHFFPWNFASSVCYIAKLNYWSVISEGGGSRIMPNQIACCSEVRWC